MTKGQTITYFELCRRPRPMVLAVAAAVAAVALAGCGTGAAGHHNVAVETPTTLGAAATSPAKAATPTATRCRAADLRADQVPVSSGTGRFYLDWSVTNTGAACVLPAGQPTLAFLDASGSTISNYGITHLATATETAVELAPGRAAWFLTEETTTTCGTGTTVGDGPFRYRIGLPGGVGAVTWTASYLEGSTLADFCGTVLVGLGDLQATVPHAP